MPRPSEAAVELGKRTDADPITQQVVANALASIADEMATTIYRTAHSTVVRDAMDFSASLCNASGEQIAQAVTIPFHLGSVPAAMRTLLAQYQGRFRPGDVFIMNDPFDGGMHIPDVFIIKPVHWEGELVGFAATTAHHADLGGRVPGSAACDSTEIFQEGLRLPWLRLYAEGEPVEDVFKIIRANVRVPRMTVGDISAQVAACSVAERGLQDLAARYTPARLAGLVDALIEHTERLVRQEIADWPDGTAYFVDHLDSDGIDVREVPVSVRITIEGDEVIADFSDAQPMVRGALNCTRSVVEAAVYQCVRSALSVEVPNTAGVFRPINVVTRPGTLMDVEMPGASSMRGVTAFRVVDAINGALAELLPHRIPAAGEGGNTLAVFGGDTAESGPFVYYELVCGTWGANPTGDGNDGLSNPASSAANIPVEVAEAEFPIVVDRYGFVSDSGGAGTYRGGLALERAWRCRAPTASLVVRSDRQIHSPYGLRGGLAGSTSRNVVVRNGEQEQRLPPMTAITMAAGEVFSHRTASGGGWGDPLERDLESIADDVLNEKVSPEAAALLYGAVVTERGVADPEATVGLRAAMRSAASSTGDLGGPTLSRERQGP